MKKYNVLLMVAAIVTVFGFQLQIKAVDEIKNKCDFNVEIYNKSSKTIQLTLNFGSQTIKTTLASKEKLNRYMPTFGKNTVSIGDNGVFYKYEINTPKVGSTIYLSWDPTKTVPLYPQTGPLMGITSTTDSGCLKKDNVTASDIQKVQ